MPPDESLPEPLQVTLLVVRVLDALQIPYFIGGSLASAIHGRIRATMDADIILDLPKELIPAFIQQLKDAFFIDPTAIKNAIDEKRSFNLVHRDTMFRIDLFPLSQQPFEQNQMQRRLAIALGSRIEDQVFFTTAEDIILAKLNWFRLGGEVSEQQWRDVKGVIQVQAEALDQEYLRLWAEQLNLYDLLERALSDFF